MENGIAVIKRTWSRRIVTWLGAWLLVQTLLFGCLAWGIGYNVLIKGASVSYTPPEDEYVLPPPQTVSRKR